jgi:hypothetical protein
LLLWRKVEGPGASQEQYSKECVVKEHREDEHTAEMVFLQPVPLQLIPSGAEVWHVQRPSVGYHPVNQRLITEWLGDLASGTNTLVGGRAKLQGARHGMHNPAAGQWRISEYGCGASNFAEHLVHST